MNDATRRTKLRHSLAMLQALEPQADQLASTLRDDHPGHAGGTSGGSRPKGSHSDPTAAAANTPDPNDTPNPVGRALADLDTLIELIHRNIQDLDHIRRTTLRLPAVIRPSDAARVLTCEHCARYNRTEPFVGIGDVGGKLDTEMRLGPWCYRFVKDAGGLPVEWQVHDHYEGKRVRHILIKEDKAKGKRRKGQKAA